MNFCYATPQCPHFLLPMSRDFYPTVPRFFAHYVTWFPSPFPSIFCSHYHVISIPQCPDFLLPMSPDLVIYSAFSDLDLLSLSFLSTAHAKILLYTCRPIPTLTLFFLSFFRSFFFSFFLSFFLSVCLSVCLSVTCRRHVVVDNFVRDLFFFSRNHFSNQLHKLMGNYGRQKSMPFNISFLFLMEEINRERPREKKLQFRSERREGERERRKEGK